MKANMMENLPRDVDSDDDCEWLDDPVACSLQPMNAAARRLPAISKPAHVTHNTHDLTLKTIRGGEGWRAQQQKEDAALKALRIQRLRELQERAAAGGVDGAAAALVAAELEDLDGERLARTLSGQDPHDVLVVHVHAPGVMGAALLDAVLATLAGRHRRAREHCASGEDRDRDIRSLPGGAILSFARLSAAGAGVTARLDVVDEDSLPALLVYQGDALLNSEVRVQLSGNGASRGDQSPEINGEAGGTHDCISASDDLEDLADDLEDLLDNLGAYN